MHEHESDDVADSADPGVQGCLRGAVERKAGAKLEGLLDSLIAGARDPSIIEHLQTLRADLAGLRRGAASNQKRYRMLLDAVPDAVMIFDEDDSIVDANAAACRRFGHSLDALKQCRVQDLNPDLPSNRVRSIYAARGVGESFSERLFNRHADGSRVLSEVHSQLFLDDGQRRVLAVARDISKQQQTLEELRASEARHRMLLDAMDKGVLIQNAAGRIISANPAACRLLGVDETELKSMTAAKLSGWRFIDQHNEPLEPEDLPPFQSMASGQNSHSMVVGVYIPHLHTHRWLSISSVPQFDENSRRLLQVVSTFSDVSALKREAEMFRTTQSLSDIGCWEMDDMRGHLFWTEQMYRILDMEPGANMGEARMLGFFTPESRARASRALGAARSNGNHFELELELHTAIGRHRWVMLSGQPIVQDDRICGVVGTLQNIDERKNLERRLRRQATRDPLTDLPNRKVILAAIRQFIQDAQTNRQLAVFYIDLDRFKVLSDMLGHRAGDRLLLAASRRLHASTRGCGRLAHLGNDEFLLVVTSSGHARPLETIAKGIVNAFSRAFELDGEKFALGVSVGIASWPEDGKDAEQLVQHADEAMFEAKRRGRSTWQRFDSVTRERSRKRLEIESQLRLAIDRGQLHLVYQPQMDMQTGQMIGVEALLRWNHPQLGAIEPEEFIPFAEVSGDIVRIGAWVIDEACRQLADWTRVGIRTGTVSINVSYRQVLSGTLVRSVREAIERHGIAGSALELEFTERVLIDSFPETISIFQQLRELGVGLLIDDFGEGFSSLNYLRHLPVDGIKISHTFMQGIPEQTTDAVLCKAMIRIAKALDLKIVAEGVENESQREFMCRHGVRFAQGYLFARPLLPRHISDFAADFAASGSDAPSF